MGRLGDRLGRWDDRSVIYRADDPEHRVAWGRLGRTYLATAALVAVLIAVGRAVGAEDLTIALIGGGSLLFLIVYVIWRRRRNRVLTGSATKWSAE